MSSDYEPAVSPGPDSRLFGGDTPGPAARGTVLVDGVGGGASGVWPDVPPREFWRASMSCSARSSSSSITNCCCYRCSADCNCRRLAIEKTGGEKLGCTLLLAGVRGVSGVPAPASPLSRWNSALDSWLPTLSSMCGGRDSWRTGGRVGGAAVADAAAASDVACDRQLSR